MPIAAVSIVGSSRMWVTARNDLEVTRLSGDAGVNGTALLRQEPWVIEDARLDPLAVGNPLLSPASGGSDELRFYAGVPLLRADATAMGTLCVLDTKPRSIDALDMSTLQDLAAIVMRELDLRAGH